jgi:signal peptidase I
MLKRVKLSPLNITANNNSFERDIRIVRSLLEAGNSVELPASGYSMFPTLKPGDRIIVKPLAERELPTPGSIVVYYNYATTEKNKGIDDHGLNRETPEQDKGSLVLHRLIAITYDGPDNPLFITRGDAMTDPDQPISRNQLMGVAFSYRTGTKENSLKNYIPGFWRYKFNCSLLYTFNKSMRFLRKLRATIMLLL